MKNSINKLRNQILETTIKIQIKFPVLYQLLEETPLFLKQKKKKKKTKNGL